jgi:tRNA(adenine34) deaminase
MNEEHELWMRLAIKEAERAYAQKEVPVGAVIVHENRIIGRGYNQIETLGDPTAHAEMIAITSAVATLGIKWLHGATMYVTLEPCAMCAGAIVLARLDRLVFGANDPKSGACVSLYQIVKDPRLNHQIEVVTGIREEECSLLLRSFFQSLRQKDMKS